MTVTSTLRHTFDNPELQTWFLEKISDKTQTGGSPSAVAKKPL